MNVSQFTRVTDIKQHHYQRPGSFCKLYGGHGMVIENNNSVCQKPQI
jgi:hypothetical protein